LGKNGKGLVDTVNNDSTLRAERVALAFAIETGVGEFPPSIGKLILFSPESFGDLRHGKIAACIRSMREQGQPIYFESVGTKSGEALYVSTELPTSVLPRDIAEIEAQSVLAAFEIRRAQSIFDDSAAALRSSPGKATSICEGAVRSLSGLADVFGNGIDGLPTIVDAAAFMDTPQAMPPELVAGVLHKGSKLAFGGSSKAFKTWCLLDLAFSVAHGVDWLGFPTAQGKVLFVNFEIQNYAWQRRIAAVARAKQVELKPGAIQLWNLRGHAADFRQLIPRIIQRARRESFALVICDPIYKLYGGTDENAAGDVAALLNSLERLAVETGAAIAFGAHFAKGNAAGKEAIDRISGSGVFARDPDSLLIFTKHEQPDSFTVEPILRNFAPVPPFVVSWKFPLMERDEQLDPAKLKQVAGRKPENVPEDLLKLLPDGGLTNPDFAQAAKEQGISERSYYRLKKELEKGGKIMLSKVNGKWTPISPKNKT
jgi:hypothetical protein